MSLRTVAALPALMEMTPPEVRNLVAEVHGQSDLATTYMQMFYVFLLINQHEAAVDMQSRALKLRRTYRIKGTTKPLLRLLVVMGPGNMQDNTPIEFVVHGSAIQTEILYLLHDDDSLPALPAHDITFIAIGESKKNAVLLERLNSVIAEWPSPVINDPKFIMNCARDKCYQLLKKIPGLLISPTLTMKREESLPFEYPITIRPIDTQGGEGLERIDDAESLELFFAGNPAQTYYVSRFLSYRSSDGYYRKMRIVLIDGTPYICHLAISDHWMVHYLSAGMADSENKRKEEKIMMESFDEQFVPRFRKQLTAVAKALKLDYVTIDCGLGNAGELLIFEVDSRGIIHAADPVHIFPYKPATMKKAFSAFQDLLQARCRSANSNL